MSEYVTESEAWKPNLD